MTLRSLLRASLLAGAASVVSVPALADGNEIFMLGSGDDDHGRFGMLAYRHTFGETPHQSGFVFGVVVREVRYNNGVQNVNRSGQRVIFGYKVSLLQDGVTTFTLGAEHTQAGRNNGAVVAIEHWQGIGENRSLFGMVEYASATESTYASFDMKMPLGDMSAGPKLSFVWDGGYRSIELGMTLGVPVSDRTELQFDLGRRKAHLESGSNRYTTVAAAGAYFSF